MKKDLLDQLRLPIMQAPMFLVSGPDMAIAAGKAGIIGSLPTANARSGAVLEQWLARISAELTLKDHTHPWAANIVVHPTYPRRDADMDCIIAHRAPLVITALGSPTHVIDRVHGYGGKVIADVNSVRFARKAVDAGVDGLVLVASGAGGHTGELSPFVFVEEVRRFFDGLVILGGGIATGRAAKAALTLGADIANIGTSFIATEESMANPAYKAMLIEAHCEDIICSDAITGVRANWLRQSLVNAGFDPGDMPKGQIDFSKQADEVTRWRDIWSAGQGVGCIDRVCSVAELVERLQREWVAGV